jgi:hypothetical protein
VAGNIGLSSSGMQVDGGSFRDGFIYFYHRVSALRDYFSCLSSAAGSGSSEELKERIEFRRISFYSTKFSTCFLSNFIQYLGLEKEHTNFLIRFKKLSLHLNYNIQHTRNFTITITCILTE